MLKTFLGVAAALAGTTLITAPAQAVEDTQSCVTRGEYQELTPGQTRDEVRALLDGDGELVARTHTFRSRVYQSCWNEFDSVVVFFERPDVDSEFVLTGKVIS